MNPVEYWPLYLLGATLVLVRVGGVIVSSPIFSSRAMPGTVKIGLTLALVIVLDPPGSVAPRDLPTDLLRLGGLILSEAIIGLAVGFATSLVFSAIQTASHLIAMQMGFSAGAMIDPTNGGNGTLLDTFYSLFSSVVFLTVNGHHWVIGGIQKTFGLVPIGTSVVSALSVDRIVSMTVEMWFIALQISLPLIGAVLLTDVTLGLLARTVPQLNVFAVGLPLKLLVGLVVLMITLPILAGYLGGTFQTMTARAQLVVK